MADDDVSQLLDASRDGDPAALETMMGLVYDDLRKLAATFLRAERPDHTLQATALVHEAYLRLVRPGKVNDVSRRHFFALAAQVMRHILVDHARARRTGKRGRAQPHVPLEEALEVGGRGGTDLVALDEALTALAARDARQGRIVELRYFGGLSIEETAEELGISAATVAREWTMARAWLRRELTRDAR